MGAASSSRERLRGVAAVLVVALVQLGIAAFYWFTDPRAVVALRPTWEALGLVVAIVAWSTLTSLPPWVDRAIAVALTFVVVVTLLIAAGQGFLQREFGRDLVLALDLPYVGSLLKMLFDNEPLGLFVLHMLLLLGGLTLAIAGPYFGVQHLRRYATGRRSRQLALVTGAVAYFTVGGAIAGVHRPVAPEVAGQLAMVWNSKDPLAAMARRLESEAAANQTLALPDGAAAGATLPRHIYLFVVEAYGQAMFSGTPPFDEFATFLASRGATLAKAGYSVRSTYRHAPVFGGGSWMAAATIFCGAPIENQKRYVSLFGSTVRCLPKLLADAGYRTVLAAPNTKQHEAELDRTYGFDQSYFKDDFHYAGPRFGWSYMPDQFVIDFMHRAEIERHPDQRLFVAQVLTSSHTPWSSVPPFVAWERIGDGTEYRRLHATEFDSWLASGSQHAAGYRTSIEYSLDAIVSYLERLPADDHSLIVVLGDHQPRQPIGNRWTDRWWVPVHVLSRDAGAVDRFAPFGYGAGFVPPAPRAEPVGHERFLPELLLALGAQQR